MQQTYNKREHFRTKVNFPISIELPNQERSDAIAVNIGNGGMLVDCNTSKHFSKLDDVNLHLPLNKNQNNYAISAKITYIKNNQIGLFFYSDPSEYLEKAFS
ncbi:MAG: PilZ domain-containing protein [gamma proteobacterium symbiont of Taylorina sp.]|nr:PilZ domain-containing protein [gamma proteobacterium symbiont of Taylorina sp.]